MPALTVGDLKAKLLGFDDSIPVRVLADHGQVSMEVCEVGLVYTPEPSLEYMIESVYESIQEAASEGWSEKELHKFVEIS